MSKTLTNRKDDYAQWYNDVVLKGGLADYSAVKGCMVIKPHGYALWENMRDVLDKMFKETGHQNAYFPLFIPKSFLSKEAAHVEGFAKECAVVTHYRLKNDPNGGGVIVDPEAKLEEELIVRPTSETIIWSTYKNWVQSYRDLPLLINQWANVVRWEMRTRLFLRTAEFLWQEGHTAHATAKEAEAETLQMLEVYATFAQDYMAMPVIRGEKTAGERFPGAVNTYAIEAMMQDRKALQAGTSHFLGTHFAEAQNIKFQNDAGGMDFCNTTSLGVSTRLIGGVIMTHGDDDGLRLPPAIAPKQIVVVPMLRDKPEDADVLAYCENLVKALSNFTAFGLPVRAHLDIKKIKSAEKRWNWVRRGAPLIVEIGPRDAAAGNVTFMRRDDLRDGDKVKSIVKPRVDFVEGAVQLLAEIQAGLYADAKARLDGNIKSDIASFDAMTAYFGEDDDSFKGWVRVAWSKPTGAALDAVEQKLKTLKLTIRNAPLDQPKEFGACIFTDQPGLEEILIGRAY